MCIRAPECNAATLGFSARPAASLSDVSGRPIRAMGRLAPAQRVLVGKQRQQGTGLGFRVRFRVRFRFSFRIRIRVGVRFRFRLGLGLG